MADKFNMDDYDLNDTDYSYEESETENFTLESILAEYKSSAFMKEERKTPPDILDRESEKIVRDVLAGRDILSENDGADNKIFEDERKTEVLSESPAEEVRQEEEEPKPRHRFNLFGKKTHDLFEDDNQSGDNETAKSVSGNTETDEGNDNVESPLKNKLSFLSGIVHREKDSDDGERYSASDGGKGRDEYEFDPEKDTYRDRISIIDRIADYINSRSSGSFDEDDGRENEIPEPDDYEPYVPEEEPEYKSEVKRFTSGLASLAVREMIILVIGAAAVLFNVLFEMGVNVPFIGQRPLTMTGVLLVMQLFSMLFGIEILISGISDIIKLEPGAESLITVSSVFTFIDALMMIIDKDTARGLPYCTVAIVAVYFAVKGRKLYRLTMAETFRAAASSADPYSVINDPDSLKGKSVLKKVRSDMDGFWRMATMSDLTEYAYTLAFPIIFAAAVGFALISTVARDNAGAFFHALASLLCVSASFASVTAYAVPYRKLSRKMRVSGSVVAGWGGACEICESDGVLITDSDIFPKGTVALTGVRMYEGAPANRIIGYTGSLIMLSESGLSDVFREYMHSKAIGRVKIDKFTYYEGGGLGGKVMGENILVGSAGFMNLMGIRVPENIYDKTAIFTAVNKKIAAAFSLSYAPSNSVRSGILSLLRAKISMLFASKDANNTPMMLQQKFKVSVDGIEYIPVEECYRATENRVPERCETLGIVYRAGLGPFAALVSNAKKLKQLVTLTTIVALTSTFAGLLYVFFLCWSGTFVINTAVNILLYLALVQAIVYILAYLFGRK